MQGTSIAAPVRTVGESLRASLAATLDTLVSALPRLIGFTLVLIVGWILSSLLARGAAALLHAIRFNDLARRSGFADFVRNMGVRQDASWFVAGIAKWFVRLITLVVAFDLLGLTAVSTVFQQLLLWLPNLLVALVVLVIGDLPPRRCRAWFAGRRPRLGSAIRTCWRPSPASRSGPLPQSWR
jgi:hypothetical protein